MKNLKDILYGVSVNELYGSADVLINNLQINSQLVKPNAIFIAIKGQTVDGHQYIDAAIKKGAKVIICQDLPAQRVENVTYIVVEDTKSALADMASNFYDNPSKKLKLVGITGTNGKTTVATLLYDLFSKLGYKVGLLSTVKILVNQQEFKTDNTTPDSLTINRYLAQMVKQGVSFCFMEVSSHGIHQKRTKGLNFTGGIFTNLTQDHLDYHLTFNAYRDVKKAFFDNLPKTAFALINADDKNGEVMLQNCQAKTYRYSLNSLADFKGKILENSLDGLLLQLNKNEIWVKLFGTFNAYNILAIYGTAMLLEVEEFDALKIISSLESVKGRFQFVLTESKISIIVDYAHTPDALKNVLSTLNTIRTGNEKLICVMGCGGDRDKDKRKKMGYIASKLSNLTIITSDNPRSENPEAIISQIELGVEPQDFKKILSITNREQAIKTASQLAQPGDIVLIAGKGHETYQEIKGVKHDFDDYKIALQLFNETKKDR
ncbi:MAG: UDP-N-acetylmuramoyl-L-alanyl-D-glutamate--2,6-diaminopimelate ligase [Flavobacteriales bacterium CG_4_9_14_0_2_um_filter_35_242]|nr:UDP-N-acetylmuramoyl-L-alanyl-D-glutamate--2,6-diaminopimelate ligase [Zetaproteobacteria bacterium]NDK18196.1 UDP-N-acetylmuramoyl-L-alanyl-D-glutamate--2,6-diaminopimelate ligase [Flavobacteriales bacterium]OIO11031.1 MAG: UDP-N-acetylmuramoyl-L-alanyl-D-glutamate--2,6-diaminopimelate ligase [Flavobacteriaceae bacterium CG1_02_35_72]PIR14752.1 MAG: UDP-N-acetylmuramoyl-L-alanyl-D-glutamate--2,6-diaminopimelate ligase [Flavobacteriales bacterium CG11_big_fil_rev_8_21_14_0_20_35_7]PIV16069.1